MTTTPSEEAPPAPPILRCLACAESVLYVATPSFEGWEHDLTSIAERFKTSPDLLIRPDFSFCLNAEGLLDVTSGSYDGPWDAERKTYTVRQGFINGFKAKDSALRVYCADQLEEGKTWATILHPG